MKWLFGNSNTARHAQSKQPATVDSIRNKLASYQAKEGKSVFIGPSTAQWGDFFEYEKVTIDPDSSGFHRIPFHC
ncbi:MAG: hypothetical protein CMK83_02835 [Pseudomonadales bacterium]|jgi:hypothetical protein|uniref:hypothetical protein n=1 Tax=unclassified Ketobacter TaxID=2639109 RepID=UPI000C3D76A2|nr:MULTISPECIES: hypothetical protein [unclassified Ketobacter]MAA59582.1 hypothetical protein [Pseudomonadales bacterium]MEC8812755.1 hypothetical protein [Pseudomonadota bacterium]TNC90542.1 MAG: hypothetical protein CSH49_02325 [Alcanivorax sp.]HAG93834.1 hypothetical protein [Gammaproteobacteria bacterium]MAQ23132.1 hypothetical protein [Pseudomonadales bacterium]|tara:strand:+ start:320 stop:544 length:225 start_codon:yes stop_codon:yes gene_type:complete